MIYILLNEQNRRFQCLKLMTMLQHCKTGKTNLTLYDS